MKNMNNKLQQLLIAKAISQAVTDIQDFSYALCAHMAQSAG